MTTLQERLEAALEMAGITQSELARRVKLSRGAVSLWFVGSTKELTGKNLLATAEALAVNPSWLATGKGEMKLGASSQRAIMGSSTATASYSVTKQDFEFIRRVNELPIECRKTLEVVLAEQERLLKPAPRAPRKFVKLEYVTDTRVSRAGNRLTLNDKKHANKR